MQYISPFKLLGIDITDCNNDPTFFNIGLLRKKIFAEFELNNSVTIKTPLGDLSKNDVIIILDQLQNKNILHYHQEIAKDSRLLSFLETNILEEAFRQNTLYQDENFLQFISPYFAHSYCTLISYLLDTPESSNPKLMKISVLISNDQKFNLLEPIRKKILNLIYEIEQINSDIKNVKNSIPNKTYQRIYGFNVLRVLNVVDYTVFEHDIEAYIDESIKLILGCVNEKNNGFRNEQLVHFILTRIDTLKLKEDTKKKVKHFRRIVEKRIKPVYDTYERSAGDSSMKGIGSLIFIIITIIRIAMACGHQN